MFQLKGVFLPLAEIITNMRKSCRGGSAIFFNLFFIFIFFWGGGWLVSASQAQNLPIYSISELSNKIILLFWHLNLLRSRSSFLYCPFSM